MPNEFNLSGLSANALKLMMVLSTYKPQGEFSNPTQRELIQAVGLTRSDQLRKARKELIKNGLLKYKLHYLKAISDSGKTHLLPQAQYCLVKCDLHFTTIGQEYDTNLNFSSGKVQIRTYGNAPNKALLSYSLADKEKFWENNISLVAKRIIPLPEKSVIELSRQAWFEKSKYLTTHSMEQFIRKQIDIQKENTKEVIPYGG